MDGVSKLAWFLKKGHLLTDRRPVPDPNTGRTQTVRREPSDRHSKGQDGPLFDQTNRRTTTDRHSRGSASIFSL